ncbi:MAG: hypothetical protein ACT4TC_14100 [Myxococcaceae bacterium]
MHRSLRVLGLALILTSCAPKTLEAKLLHAERRANDVEKSLEKAERAMSEVKPDAAEGYLDDAKKGLLDEDIDYYPEHTMLRDRYKADLAKIPLVQAELARREREARIQKRIRALQEARVAFEKAMEAVRSDLDEAKDAREEVEEAIADGKDVSDAPAFVAEVQEAKKSLERAQPRIRMAEQTLAFEKGPKALYEKTVERDRDARGEKDRQERAEELLKVRDSYMKCRSDATQALAEAPGLERLAKPIVTACAAGVKGVELALRKKPPVKRPATVKSSARVKAAVRAKSR